MIVGRHRVPDLGVGAVETLGVGVYSVSMSQQQHERRELRQGVGSAQRDMKV
jgi:hypothetical protein